MRVSGKRIRKVSNMLSNILFMICSTVLLQHLTDFLYHYSQIRSWSIVELSIIVLGFVRCTKLKYLIITRFQVKSLELLIIHSSR